MLTEAVETVLTEAVETVLTEAVETVLTEAAERVTATDRLASSIDLTTDVRADDAGELPL